MAEMTEARKAQMKALEQKATAGPWEKQVAGIEGDNYIAGTGPWYRVRGLSDQALADAEFIAAARSFVPDALAAIERLEGENAKRTAVTTAQTVALTELGEKYANEFNRAETLQAQLAARDAEVARNRVTIANAEGDLKLSLRQSAELRAEVARLTEENSAVLSTLGEIGMVVIGMEVVPSSPIVAQVLNEISSAHEAARERHAECQAAEAALATLRANVRSVEPIQRLSPECIDPPHVIYGCIFCRHTHAGDKLSSDSREAHTVDCAYVLALGLTDTERHQ